MIVQLFIEVPNEHVLSLLEYIISSRGFIFYKVSEELTPQLPISYIKDIFELEKK